MCIHIKSNSNIFAKEGTMSNTNQVPSNEQLGVPRQKETVNASPFILSIIVAVIFCIAGYGAWDFYREHQVISSQRIGEVTAVQASGGFNAGMVVEINSVYYPLDTTMVVRKGSTMSIETRSNGSRFLCDDQRIACARTSTNIPK